jgi:hypothetical protein
MTMNLLEALNTQPWLPMGTLVELTGSDPVILRVQLASLMESGSVKKTGEKRGTKYGMATNEAPASNAGLDFKAEILKVLEEEKGRVSRKTLCEKIGTYDAKIRPSLLELVEKKIVLDNNKKKGQLFWLARHESEGLIEEEPAEEEKVVVEKIDRSNLESLPKVRDPIELVRLGLSQLPTGPKAALTIDELKSHIMSAARHDFSHSTISDAIHTLKKDETYGRLKHEVRNYNGNRVFYWVE